MDIEKDVTDMLMPLIPVVLRINIKIFEVAQSS
jgi:hypothetical protein